MKLKKDALDLVFPQFCIGCNNEGKILCQECCDKLIINPQKICPVCKMADEARNCAGSQLDNLWTLSHYQDNLVAESVQKLKYEYLIDFMHDYWKAYLQKFWQLNKTEINSNHLLIPVPLHRKRLLERGFNQSELIASELAAISGLPIEKDLLKRAIYNEPQVGMNGSRRLENIKGIFSIDYKALSRSWDKEIILIDDVYTTGSTMSECAKILKSAGFKRINGLVLAVD
ncbi:MAG: phosphoribosyltransferase family protein [Candidatus Buchananbacteria bacterium]|jgi:ComF family protein